MLNHGQATMGVTLIPAGRIQRSGIQTQSNASNVFAREQESCQVNCGEEAKAELGGTNCHGRVLGRQTEKDDGGGMG